MIRLRRFGRSPDRSVGDEYEWERKEDTPSLVPLRSKRASAEQGRGRGEGDRKFLLRVPQDGEAIEP
ncbi:MAG: hypothetical protein A2825_00370 [Candidatus Taylorbacteria bacterium RIFCSPHIGHO2_01_FULL_43_120]|nr:MAG: hypothetical protein A2825_00370 [Candidatus Taylorbacteria bacterium RIFCSPHIGHO2_01_FULL_43_120]OHA22739.1 MAG: hypothetical protein A3B98_01035 [Candidatus Taylorbacteria bacterium RIFCSPHIGHO2_02_FULL_43_55]OHA30656.1 MAG: hypothetical protein A3B09_00480 [Candidatus Taylorbacteria bacterium RIFCSPLOWO2_01_FULL_43_83]OHA38184.1 MAG: hypothetical protein A3H58_04415 [Candidatus Taylorbacteria bacterium RIFCSPLOWO2_02_FULL_43_22b]